MFLLLVRFDIFRIIVSADTSGCEFGSIIEKEEEEW